MRLGNTDIASVKLGSSPVQAVYLGTNLVWQNAPVAIAATGVGTTSFTANWNAYTGAAYYLLDVSASSDFSTFIYENQVTTSTSYVVIGLESNTTYYYRVRATVEADVQAFFQRVSDAGGTLTITEQIAIINLVADLKSDGIWTKMKAIYPMVGASAAACAQNLKSSSFTGTFTSGWTFASTGVTGNGSSTYFDTGLNALTNLSLDNTHISFYCRTNNSQGGVDMGTLNTTIQYYSGTLYYRINSGTYVNNGTQPSDGMSIASRLSSTISKFYKNASLFSTNSNNSTTVTNKNLYLGAWNEPNKLPTNREYAFASIGDGLTDDESGYLYTAVQGFNTTLDRYVGAPWYDNGELLLDTYPDSAAAYSLRKLRNNYVGGPIRVRRSSDNTEQDIYFDANGELDTAQLTTFCGAGDGFVKTWYDQSGNSKNATQTTAANQPQIVSSGSVILENGQPIINGLDNTDFLVIDNSISKANITSIFSVASLDTNATFYVLLADGSNTAFMVSQLNSVATTINLNVGTPTVYKNSSLYTITTRGDAYNDFQGQKLISLIGGSTNFSPLNIGYGVGVEMYKTQEIVIYNSDQSSNRTGIETNINSFYSIY